MRSPRHTSRMVGAAAVALAVLVACASGARQRAITGAIARAETFLQTRGAAIDPMTTLVLVRLERRYGLAWTAKQRAEVLAAAPPRPLLRLFSRLVDPVARLDRGALASISNGSDLLILAALYCGEIGPPPLTQLEAFAQKPGAAVAHGALALQWAVENGCLEAPATAALRQQFVDGLIKEAAQAPATDVGIESMAMLEYLGAADRIDPAWMDAIVAAQHPDGGWGERPPDPSNDHTTALALWVLLAASGRPAVDGPWIPRA